MRKFLPLIVIMSFIFVSAGFFSIKASTQDVDNLFAAKQWKALDEYFKTHGNSLSPRELSVYANALWFQNRYDEALQILLKIQDKFPPSVKPYGEFYTALAFERTNKKEEARSLLYKLWPVSPQLLRFYVSYGLFRTEAGEEREKWARAMLSSAMDDSQKLQALTALFSLNSAGIDEACTLLDIKPLHQDALKLLKNLPLDSDPRIPFYLGYAAFLNGNYREADALLKKISQNSPHWQKAYYYRAYSNYKLKNYDTAAMLWGKLASDNTSFSVSSVGRLATLADNGNVLALDILKEVAGSKSKSARAALYYLMRYYENIGDSATAQALSARILSEENDIYSTKILWQMGWKAWKQKDAPQAAEYFMRAATGVEDDLWASRTLYWASRAYDQAGDTKQAEALKNKLKINYPLTYYGLLVDDLGGKIQDDLPKAFKSKPSQMEEWGFVFWESRILSQRPDPSSRYRASQLLRWLGIYDMAYNVARPLESYIKGDKSISGKLLETLYPRPYEPEVRRSCKEFDVDPHVVWAIMRQESAFNSNATSWVGASGLMQLMPATAKDEANKLKLKDFDLYSPETNIRLGVAHFSWLLGRLKRLPLALAAYNAGIGNVSRWLPNEDNFDITEWIEEIPFSETLTYVRKVLANYKVYSALYGDKI